MKIVICMPTFNEKGNIGRMIDELFEKYFPEIKDAEMHLLVIDNNSADGTGKIVREKMARYKNLHLIPKQKKPGLGWAYIEGMQYAMNTLKADAILEMDADFQHPPRFIKPMVDAFLDGADYCIGSRYIKGGSVPKEWALFRKAVSYFGNLFIRVCLLNFKIHDLTTGFRLTRVKGILEKIDLNNLMEPTRFAHKSDLLYQTIKLSKKVVEVPLEFAQRTEEQSKFNPKEMVSSFKVAIILGIKDKQRFIKFGTVGFIGYIINAFALKFFTSINAPSIIAWAIPVELAIISNFTLNNIWTFKSKRISGFGMIIKKFLTFNGTSLGALLIQTAAGLLGDRIFGIGSRQLTLPFIIVFLVLPFNYFMYNVVIWKTWKNPFAKKNKA
jgi:dolichol-phosphate mannosyltransferase